MKKDISEKWVFIINPTAGNGFAGTYAPKVEEMIQKYKINADIVFTEQKGHAQELSEGYEKKGYKYIIAVGGDGTLNEVARPLIGNKNVTIGIVPAGTGNDFIQILGFPNRFTDREWDIFFAKNEITMDVGKCNGTIFLNGMGLGFDAQVASENYSATDDVKKGGKDKYIWHILKNLLFFKEKRMIVITENGRQETNVFINTISIGRRFAGSFFLTPKAIANDGLFDVCMIKNLSIPNRLKILLQVPKGKHIHDENVIYYQADKVSLEFADIVPYHVDGEMFFNSKFDVYILPESIKTIYNPSGNHFFNS